MQDQMKRIKVKKSRTHKVQIQQTCAHTMCLAPRIRDAGSRNSAFEVLAAENLAESSSGKVASSKISFLCKH